MKFKLVIIYKPNLDMSRVFYKRHNWNERRDNMRKLNRQDGYWKVQIIHLFHFISSSKSNVAWWIYSDLQN